MVCKHLSAIEHALLSRSVTVTFRGQAWSQNCREWVYFDCFLDTPAIRKHFSLAPCVRDHVHNGTHDGQELGFVCTECKDAVVGLLEPTTGKPVFQG